jgi:RNA ligase
VFYDFPTITNISDLLPAIEGDKSFIIADRGDHTVVNYVITGPETFPSMKVHGGSPKMRAQRKLMNALRRECRGIIFDKEGKVLRRPYHKFFNLNERDETQFADVDLSHPHVILEKLDGSMIVPYRVNGRVIWGTKMGDTEVASPVHDFVKKNPQYVEFFEFCEHLHCSPIFEWMSRKQRIVIDHPVDRLVLTAIRAITDGSYASHDAMQIYGSRYGIEVVQEFPVDGKTSIEEICEYVRTCQDTEGVVIRFDNGHMLKLKTDDYVRIHKAKDAILKERNVVDMIINEKLDDVMAMLPEEDREELEGYQSRFWKSFNERIEHTFAIVKAMQKEYATNKDYSLGDRKKYHMRFTVRCVFQFLERREMDDDSLRDAIFAYTLNGLVRVNLNNDTKFREMKQEAFPNVQFIQNRMMN